MTSLFCDIIVCVFLCAIHAVAQEFNEMKFVSYIGTRRGLVLQWLQHWTCDSQVATLTPRCSAIR